MSTEGEFWSDVRAARKDERNRLGVECPECIRLLPKASPSILLPQQRCRIHNYRDPRPRNTEGKT